MADERDQRLGKYRLIQLIGESNSAWVYRGQDVFDKTVAVKRLKVRLEKQQQYARFKAEAEQLRQLGDQRYMVQVLDYGIEGDQPYLVMEDVPNGSLRQMFSQYGPQAPGSILPYVLHIAAALRYVQGQRLVHGNLKPENVLLGSSELILTDCGIPTLAHLRNQITDQAAAYRAPEQIRGIPATAASDQYALGVMIYEWLTGTLPSQVSVASLRQGLAMLSSKIAGFLEIALAQDPTQRFNSITAFATAFDAACKSAQTSVQVGETRSAPYPAIAVTSQVQPALVLASATAGTPDSPKNQPSPSGKGGQAAPSAFKLWDFPQIEPPPPDPSPTDARGVGGVGGFLRNLGSPSPPGADRPTKKPRVRLLIVVAALVVIVLLSSSVAFGLAGHGPLSVLHRTSPVVAAQQTPRASASTAPSKQPPATNTTVPTAAPTKPVTTTSLVAHSSAAVQISPGSQHSTTAQCQNDEHLVGGGYVIEPKALTLTADNSYPSDQNTWTASLTNGSQQTVTLTVFAECLRSNTNLGITIAHSTSTTVPPGTAQAALATCASGVAVGGGFMTNPAANGLVVSSMPASSQQAWSISTKSSNSALNETAYALCATTNVGTLTTPSQSIAIPPKGFNSVQIPCNSPGDLLTSTGFSSNSPATGDGSLFFSVIEPQADGTSWQVGVYNKDANTHTALITAVCLSGIGS